MEWSGVEWSEAEWRVEWRVECSVVQCTVV